MKRLLLLLAACMLLVAGLSACEGDAAFAAEASNAVVDRPVHSPNFYASWGCAGTRPSTHYTQALHDHAEAFVGSPPSLLVSCNWRYPALGRCAWWISYVLPDGTPFGPLEPPNFYDCP